VLDPSRSLRMTSYTLSSRTSEVIAKHPRRGGRISLLVLLS